MRYWVVVVLAMVSIALGSCGRKRVEDAGEKAPPDAADSLRALITLNEGSYAAREPVVMTLTVRNTTDRTINLTFPTAQRYDFIVSKGKMVVWQWSHGRMFAQVRGRHSVAPGDSISYDITWDQKDLDGVELKLGTYGVQGILKASPEIASEEKTFWIAD
jgi:hypothetical protein